MINEDIKNIRFLLDTTPMPVYIMDSLNRAIQVIKTQPRWIPVTECQPNETGIYIATVKYGDKYAVGQRYYHGQYVGWEDSCVIAWMLFPEPYKEGDTDE